MSATIGAHAYINTNIYIIKYIDIRALTLSRAYAYAYTNTGDIYQ